VTVINRDSGLQSEVKLAISTGGSEPREVRLPSTRFTVGRSVDDDLVIDDPGLSRRHALIEIADAAVLITDCGSRNGTFVNGNKISGPTPLKDGDVISIGSIASIKVLIGASGRPGTRGPVAGAPPGSITHRRFRTRAGQQPQESVSRRLPEPNRLARAGVASAMILVLVLLVAFLKAGSDRAGDSSSARVQFQQAGDPGPSPTPDAPSDIGKAAVPGGISRDQVERGALQVVKQISNDDQQYSFPTEALDRVVDRINQYRASPGFIESLRSIAPHTQSIAEQARPMIEPALVIYTALAETSGRPTDRTPAEAARASLPVLRDIWKLLGNRTADDSLVLVAAYKIGPVTTLDRTGRRSHPLLATMRRIAQGSDAKRNVWYLYKQNGIDQGTYEFVIGFLAAGVLAQHPKEFGLDAEPLAF
jgi:predicted component of type VI protein secretion system